MPKATSQLLDPRTQAIRLETCRFGPAAYEPPRTNFFTIDALESGHGEFWADAAKHVYAAPALLFFTPYQHVRFASAVETQVTRIQFHANFLCIETFHAESGCAGTLFGDLYHPPVVVLEGPARREVQTLLKRMLAEQQEQPLAFDEMLLAQLKMLLLTATRVKARATTVAGCPAFQPRHPVLTKLKALLDEHFARWHAPAEYARALHMTPKTLGRVVREQLGKSLTELIRERILTHAKWQLLHTLKPVKQVAREVGFRDELYFSRMFKKATGYAPLFFRAYETEVRGGSNLSMLSTPRSIPAKRRAADH
jgi:AraC family transcriptional activator of pobA